MDITTLKQMIDAAKKAAHEGRMDIVEATLARMESRIDRMEVPALQDVEKSAQTLEAEIDKATPPGQPVRFAGSDDEVEKALQKADEVMESLEPRETAPEPPLDDAPEGTLRADYGEPMGDGVADAEGF